MRDCLFVAALFAALAVSGIGCAPAHQKPGMVQFYGEPSLQAQKDPGMESKEYRRFVLVPVAEQATNLNMNPIVEKQLLYAVGNELEFLGYERVEDIKDADFYVGVLYSDPYKSVYIPPSVRTVPWYVPGGTQTTYMNLYGSGGHAWGTATTTTPGYYVPTTVTTPGRYVGAYYPTVAVYAFNAESKKAVWTGCAIGATPDADIRMAANLLIPGLCDRNFPVASNAGGRDRKNGIFGCPFRIFTTNGNDYFPVITAVWFDSPAEKAGLKPYDVVLAVDGIETKNRHSMEVFAAFDKDPGETLRLTVNRDSTVIDLALVAEDEGQFHLSKARSIDYNSGVKTGSIDDLRAQRPSLTVEDLLNLVP